MLRRRIGALKRPWRRPAPEFTPADIDDLIGRAGAARPDEALDCLTDKLDHLVHALRRSGRLARLSREQVVTILHALRSGGHEQVPPVEYATYNQDGLLSIHNADFLGDARFEEAFRRGAAAAGTEYPWHWRVHVGLWAADHAARLPGDFVECGVNRGFMSSAIMRYLDWNALGRRFILMDTFNGLDEAFISDEERALGKTGAFHGYTECYELARANFAEFRNVEIIRGSIPLTLPRAATDAVCFLHLDMNCVIPEVAAIEYFWDRLVPGAVVLLDDYGARGYEPQKRGMDEFATKRGIAVLSLPTCQGLILKSPSRTGARG
jgi:Macrocin-O-methyltransferase (TylF)